MTVALNDSLVVIGNTPATHRDALKALVGHVNHWTSTLRRIISGAPRLSRLPTAVRTPCTGWLPAPRRTFTT